MGKFLGIAIAVALITSLIASIVTYQDSPPGKKWRCVFPVGAYAILGVGSAFVLGIMKGLQMVDTQTSRYAFLGVCALVTAYSALIAAKRRR